MYISKGLGTRIVGSFVLLLEIVVLSWFDVVAGGLASSCGISLPFLLGRALVLVCHSLK